MTNPDPPKPPTPTPPEYTPGCVKQDPASKMIAVRTTLYSVDGAMDWGVMSTDRGGSYSNYDGVAAWSDISNGSYATPAEEKT